MKTIWCLLVILVVFMRLTFASDTLEDSFICEGDCDFVSFRPTGFFALLPAYQATDVSVRLRDLFDLSDGKEVILEFNATIGGFNASASVSFFDDQQSFLVGSWSYATSTKFRVHLTQKRVCTSIERIQNDKEHSCQDLQPGEIPTQGYIGFPGLSSSGGSTRPGTILYFNMSVDIQQNSTEDRL